MVARPVAVAPGALISMATTVAAHLARSAAPPAAVRAVDVSTGFGGGGRVRPLDVGTGGAQPLKPAAPPRFPLDLAAIRQLAPGRLGPFGYTELVPGSGVGMPDPSVNALHPGLVRPSAKAPLDLGDIVRRPPGALVPRGFMELVPGSGVWVPDPAGRSEARQPPKFPLDVASIVRLAPRELGPRGFMELVPGSGVWVPDPDAPH
jgi:hypothetical protein